MSHHDPLWKSCKLAHRTSFREARVRCGPAPAPGRLIGGRKEVVDVRIAASGPHRRIPDFQHSPDRLEQSLDTDGFADDILDPGISVQFVG